MAAIKDIIGVITECGAQAGMSWDGKNIHGDKDSIDSVWRAVHDSEAVLPALRAEVAALQADAERLDWLLDNAITIVMLRAQTLQTQDRAGIDAARSA